jgi:uncharacterized protein involved in outer membrane biogenesis
VYVHLKQTGSNGMSVALRKTLKATGIVVGSLIAIVLLVLALLNWDTFKHPLERIASAKTGRTVSIGGKLEVHIWSWTPTVVVNQLTLGNPPWESTRPMATVERLEIHLKLLPLLKGDVILPRVALYSPDVYLHQDKSGRANWTFENKAPTNAPASKPSKLPAVRDLLIQNGKLTLLDEMRRLKVNGSIQAQEQKSNEDPTPFRIQGTGTINEEHFEFQVAGGPLLHLDPEHPYPFDLHIVAGSLEVDSKGRALKPFDLGQLDFEVDLSGKDLAEGFYLTQLALPNTAPFKLHAHIARNDQKIAVSDIAGTVGDSDLHGKLDIDASRKRPYMSGALVSRQLRMKDLAASLGGQHNGADLLDAKSQTPKTGNRAPSKTATPADPDARLFPDAHLQVDRVRAMDADVRFKQRQSMPVAYPSKRWPFG